MKKKLITLTILILTLVSALSIPANLTMTVVAEEDASFEELDAVGTHFELQTISISTDTLVHIVLRASSNMITYLIESASEATSTQLTLDNLEPLTTYYMYEDSYVNEILVTADVNGSHAYTQDLTHLHHVFIQPSKGTIFISEDTTLQSDIYGSVEIVANNVVLDGNGHRIIGPGYGIGINNYQRTGVTIENCVVEGFMIGIMLLWSTHNTIRSNVVQSNSWSGIILSTWADHNTIADNYVSSSMAGVDIEQSSYNVIEGNYITGSGGWQGGYGGGVFLVFSATSYNVATGNSFVANGAGIHIRPYIGNNAFYHNNFIGNAIQVYHSSYVPNTFDNGYPSGGNYWSDYTGSDEFSGPYQDEPGSDGIGDTPYWIQHAIVPTRDRYPLVHANMQPSINGEILVIKSWDLDLGVERSLTKKLEEAVGLLDRGNINGAIHKLTDLIKKVTNDAYHLTQAQKDYIIETTQEIIDYIG